MLKPPFGVDPPSQPAKGNGLMTATTPAHHHALSRFEQVALAAIIANTIVLVWV